MNILINMQTFLNDDVYNKIITISQNTKIDNIYITSSLMNDLEKNIIDKYNKINKVQYIESNSLFTQNIYTKNCFNLSKDIIAKTDMQCSDLTSAARWLPISKRNDNDINSFSMVFYYDIYNFWNIFFNNYNIDYIISLNDEHSSKDSILIKSAKNNNIQNIITSTIIGAIAEKSKEYFAFYNNHNYSYINLKQFKNSYDSITSSSDTNFGAFSNDYKIKKIDTLKYLLISVQKQFSKNSSIIKALMNIKEKVYILIKSKILLSEKLKYIKQLKQYYDNISSKNIDINLNYVYYCLHFDPEATTLPKDDIYSNQLLNIRIISSSLPKGWKLYVKEHPHQLKIDLYKNIFLNQLHAIDMFRSKNFYKYITDLDNVELISLTSNHKEVMSNAQFIASNTGTVFREATYMKKKCLTFSSKSIYSLLSNVYVVKDCLDCKRLFDEDIYPNFKDIDVDKLFYKYSIVVNNLNKRDSILLDFIYKNLLNKEVK
jgi:hypothetical protein